MDEFTDRHKAFEREAGRKLDDFNLELSGSKSGYMYRTSASGNDPSGETQTENQRKKTERALTALELARRDPAYAALYNDILTMVQDAARRAEENLTAAERAVAARGQELDDVLDGAAKLHPSGEAVFLDQDGNAVRRDGTPLSPSEAASIVWPDEAPSYKDYLARRDALEAAREAEARWRDYQSTVGEAWDRLEDEDNPPSVDELEEIQERVETTRPDFLESPSTSAQQATHESAFATSIPDLS